MTSMPPKPSIAILGLYRGNVGIMEKKMETTIILGANIGITEKNMGGASCKALMVVALLGNACGPAHQDVSCAGNGGC